MTRLSTRTLAELDPSVTVPTYRAEGETPRRGIVHLGVGGFHRAHQAMYLDRLMSHGAALDWGICGVGVLPRDEHIVRTLTDQDGLYTLMLKHPDGTREARVIGSIVELLHAPADPQRVVDTMADEATRVVSLTITEGGYLIDRATGRFDPTDPAVADELAAPAEAAPLSAFGFIVAALAARRAAGQLPFTVMSCDNLPGNGDVTKHVITSFARVREPELADWIEANVAFPNSMVDRITPVTAEEDTQRLQDEHGIEDGWPVVCEPFTQWVLEDHFTQGRPPVQHVGVQVVEDVVPFELMKLRLLNASHQALCYLGYLAGYRYAHEVCADPLFVDFLLGYMEHEGSPTLPPVPDTDLDGYRHTLIERFANPEVRDTLARLCAESSDRIPSWLVPVIRHNLEHGGQVQRSALVVAAWARYAEGVDEQGEPIEVVDQLREQVLAAAQQQREDPLAFLRSPALFGDLVEQERFTEAYREALESLHEVGARATLEAWVRG